MNRKILNSIIIIALSVLIISCAGEIESLTKEQADIDYDVLLRGGDKKISYINQARPVLEKRCVVCHGCYDAPCQLKLTSVEGIKRGANPKKVYNAERIFADEPTRLMIDASSEAEWRDMGFHSVLNEKEENEVNNLRHSVLYKMLRLKQLNPQPRTGMLSDNIDLGLDREQSCPVNKEFDDYAEDFPDQGMPFAMPNISDEEYHILVKWISQGMPDDSQVKFSSDTKNQINKWEEFFNLPDAKHQLVSRYIYEHLFIGHIHFKGADNREFFRLVRSYTPPGEEIKEIATVRAFDDPGVDKFYYRFRYYKSSIVDKTHIVYELSDKRMDRYKELFLDQDYEVSTLPSYKLKEASNPIKTFTNLPVESRYRFLLDDAKYFIEGFIKGPVCRGQVALNVIEDNFWVFFTDPEKLNANRDGHYLDEMREQLRIPTEQGNTLNLLSIWTTYWDELHVYMLKRQEYFKQLKRMELGEALTYIWDGKGGMDKKNQALTIYRHFDSATVKQGLLGDYPESAWVLDYPIFERIHYLLVAGYDVYGNVGHQLNTRLYMDFLRMEAENTFLAFMPISHRKKIRDSWYLGIRQDVKKYFEQPKDWLNVQVVYGYESGDPQRELYHKLETRMKKLYPDNNYIDRCHKANCRASKKLSHVDKQLQRIAEIKGERLKIFPDLAVLRVIDNKQDKVFTLINNKGYKNISFILNDVADRDRSSDTMSVYRGILGAYPNFFFVVHENELETFTDKLLVMKVRDDYEQFVSLYGVRRTSSDFWKQADWFYDQYAKQDPVGYGILDLYRYNNR